MSAIHEDFGRSHHGGGPSNRNFGSVFTVVLLLYGVAPLRHGNPVHVWPLALGVAFLLVTVIRPSLLAPGNRIWTAFGRVLGKVVNPVVMGVLFYVVFTPGAVILRWLGKDLLRLKRRPGEQTYWISRDGESLSSMTEQF